MGEDLDIPLESSAGGVAPGGGHEPGFGDAAPAAHEVTARAFKAAPTFDEQLAVMRAGEQRRPYAYTHRTSHVNYRGEWEMGTQETVGESEMLFELDRFLQDGEAAANYAGDAELAERAALARKDMTYIGRPELNEALGGLASYWADYLTADPSNTIVFFSPAASRGQVKSVDYIGRGIAQKLQSMHPDLADRVRSFDADDVSVFDGLQAEHAKIVMPDDWVSTGAMMSADARQVARSLRQSGHTDLISKIETNLVVARDDQLQSPLTFITEEGHPPVRQQLPTVAYYWTPASRKGMDVWGSHSTVDHNDAFLKRLAEYKALENYQHGEGAWVQLPRATLAVRPYSSDPANFYPDGSAPQSAASPVPSPDQAGKFGTLTELVPPPVKPNPYADLTKLLRPPEEDNRPNDNNPQV